MLRRLRPRTEQLEWSSERENSVVSSSQKEMRGGPRNLKAPSLRKGAPHAFYHGILVSLFGFWEEAAYRLMLRRSYAQSSIFVSLVRSKTKADQKSNGEKQKNLRKSGVILIVRGLWSLFFWFFSGPETHKKRKVYAIATFSIQTTIFKLISICTGF